MSDLHNQCHSSLKHDEIMAKIFADNDSKVEYFYENNMEK
jgi:hypothetical protein